MSSTLNSPQYDDTNSINIKQARFSGKNLITIQEENVKVVDKREGRSGIENESEFRNNTKYTHPNFSAIRERE